MTGAVREGLAGSALGWTALAEAVLQVERAEPVLEAVAAGLEQRALARREILAAAVVGQEYSVVLRRRG